MNLKSAFFFTLISFLSISCQKNENNSLSGYIEGEYTYIASGIGGTLEKINVTRGMVIQKNHLLYQLDLEPDRAFMEEAIAEVAQLKPGVEFSKIQLGRFADLFKHGAASKSDLDQAQTDYQARIEALQSSQKALIQAEWALNQKTVYAPVTGFVFDTFYRVGEKVPANQPVLALLTPDNIHVLFYIPEQHLSRIHLGQTLSFNCDRCKTRTTATINYIASDAEYTPPIIYSRETRNSLVYLVRAKMPPEVAMHFHPGQPIDVYLNE